MITNKIHFASRYVKIVSRKSQGISICILQVRTYINILKLKVKPKTKIQSEMPIAKIRMTSNK